MSDPYRDDPIARARAEGRVDGLIEASGMIQHVLTELPAIALRVAKTNGDLVIARELQRMIQAIHDAFVKRAKEVAPPVAKESP